MFYLGRQFSRQKIYLNAATGQPAGAQCHRSEASGSQFRFRSTSGEADGQTEGEIPRATDPKGEELVHHRRGHPSSDVDHHITLDHRHHIITSHSIIIILIIDPLFMTIIPR